MLKWISNLLFGRSLTTAEKEALVQQSGQAPPAPEASDFIWCLVGNVVDEHLFGENKELRHGTKHFSPGTKVYCLPAQWGDGYENIKLIGRHRKTTRNVCIVMPAKQVTNWRLQKVYRPYILNVMRTQRGWTSSEADKDRILWMVEMLKQRESE